MIKIYTRQFVDLDSREGYIVTKIEGFRNGSSFPTSYNLNYPRMERIIRTTAKEGVLSKEGIIAKLGKDKGEHYVLEVGQFYTKDLFSKIMTAIRYCGDEAHECMKPIREARKKWHMKEEFEI